MNRTIQISVLVMLSTAFFIGSCRKKEKIVEVPVPGETVYVHDTVKNFWKEDGINSFLTNLQLTNAGTQGRYLSFVTSYGHKMSADSTSMNFGDLSSFPHSLNELELTLRPAMKYGLCVTAVENVLTISGIVPRYLGMENWFYCDLKKFRPDFAFLTGYSFVNFHNSVITEGNSVLLPVTVTNTMVNVIYRFDLKIDMLNASSGFVGVPNKIDTISTALIVIPSTNPSAAYRRIVACGNIGKKAFIYVQANQATYVIDENNSFRKVSDQCLYSFFRHDGIDYALAHNTNKLLASNNGGESWTDVITLTNQNSRIFEFDNRLICISGFDLYEVIMSGQQIEFKKLMNTGLENRVISSVNRFAGKVYVTTNGGLYYCSYKDFYTYAK